MVLLILTACHSSNNVEHRGEKMQIMQVENIDSLVVSIDSLSGNGNFFLLDSCVYFADTQLGSIFGFSLKDGRLISRNYEKEMGIMNCRILCIFIHSKINRICGGL